MNVRTYRFDCSLLEAFGKCLNVIKSLEDYYPLDVSMVAQGDNEVRYPSNRTTVHHFNQRALKAALYYPIQNGMESWALDAAANGDNSGVKTLEVILEITERRKSSRSCPCCNHEIHQHFHRHVRSCSKGKACMMCMTVPEDLEAHQTECTGNE